MKSIELITRVIAEAIIDSRQTADMKRMDREEEAASGKQLKEAVNQKSGLDVAEEGTAGVS